MNYIEAKVTYDHPDPELAGDLIAGGFFACRPRLPRQRRSDGSTLCGLGKANRRDGKPPRAGLPHQLSRAGRGELGRGVEAFFWPHKIGRRIVVKPSWRDYNATQGEIVIELDPGMAFGTGTHPTTSLCVQLVEAHLRKGDAFLDIGTGSGILMAAAGKLGAGRLAGSDRDELAVRIATENLRRNGIKEGRFLLGQGFLAAPFKGPFDIVASNILTHIILELLDDIPRVLKKGGIFICSGIIAENQNLVVGKMKTTGFEILEILLKEGWVAIAGRYHD